MYWLTQFVDGRAWGETLKTLNSIVRTPLFIHTFYGGNFSHWNSSDHNNNVTSRLLHYKGIRLPISEYLLLSKESSLIYRVQDNKIALVLEKRDIAIEVYFTSEWRLIVGSN